MTRKAEQIKQAVQPNYPEWTRTFRSFLRQHYSDDYFSETEEYEIWEAIEKMYASLMEAMMGMSGIKDQWEGPEYLPLAVKAGLEVYYRALKLECPFFFGTDELGFFLSADLTYSENLRKMDDRFWYRMAELTRLGELDIWEHKGWHGSQVKREPWFHRKAKSKIFHLIRSAVAWEKHEGDSADLGMIIVRWDYDTPWEVLLDNGSAALQNLYRMNETLWKRRPK